MPVGSVVRTALPRAALSFVSETATALPPQSSFEEILVNTEVYFENVLMREYQNNPNIELLDISLTLENTRFGLGFPFARYNLYVDFSASIEYTVESTPQTANEQFELLGDSITTDYIVSEIRTSMDNAFQNVIEVSFDPAQDLMRRLRRKQ